MSRSKIHEKAVHSGKSAYLLHSRALFISSTRGMPDPEGAAILLESLDKITDDKSLEIDPKHLRKQGAALRVKLEKIIQCQDLRTQSRSITRVT